MTGAVPHRLYLIDGSGYIFRAFHALPPLTRKSDGMPVGAVSGFCNMLAALRERAEADGAASHMAVIFDAGRHTFRNDIYPAYKANRDETPPELVPQFAPIKEATRAFGLHGIEMPGFEADDLIATFAAQARAAGMEVVIVSSDKDLMQLVRDGVSLLDPMKNRAIGPAEVMEKFGVAPDRVVDVQALAGDSSDNVPGVPGIGIKTAAELINGFGDLDTLLARASEIKQTKRRENLQTHAELARISRELVRLKKDVPVTQSLDELSLRAVDWPRLDAFLESMEFRSLRARLAARFSGLVPPSRTQASDPDRPRLSAAPASDAPAAAAAQAYELVQDLETLRRWVARAEAAGIVAVDTETTSLTPTRAELVGISLSTGPGEACYIPLGHTSPDGAALILVAAVARARFRWQTR